MTYAAVHNAIRSRFSTQWGSTTPIVWDNVTSAPPESASWVRLNIADTDANQASFGAPTDTFRHFGLVTIMVFSVLNVGDAAALALADTAAAVFRKWNDSTTGLRFIQSPFTRQVGVERKWFHLNVTCPFQWDGLF
jgi:hypothetical protein